MEVSEAIRDRRSIRRYRRKKLPNETLEKLLEAARLAPTGMNRQPWELVVVTDQAVKDKLVPVCRDQKFISDCSAFIAGVDILEEKWHRVDLAIAMEHIVLMSVELGLGTCWIGAFQHDKVKEILGIPADKDLVVCMVVGYPDEKPPQKEKKPLTRLIHYNKY